MNPQTNAFTINDSRVSEFMSRYSCNHTVVVYGSACTCIHLLGSSLLGCKSAELLCTLFGMLSFLFTTFF